MTNYVGAYAFNASLYLPTSLVQAEAPPGTPPPFVHQQPLPPGSPDEDLVLDDGDDTGGPNYAPQAQKAIFYKLSELNRPWGVPVFADGIWPEAHPSPTDAMPLDLENGFYNPIANQMGRMTTRRHGRLVNVSFFDGHVESLPIPQLWAQEWHKGWVTPKLPLLR